MILKASGIGEFPQERGLRVNREEYTVRPLRRLTSAVEMKVCEED